MLMKSTNLEWLGGISMFLFECTRHILQISFAYHECHLRPLYYTVVDTSLFSNNKEERQGGLLQLLQPLITWCSYVLFQSPELYMLNSPGLLHNTNNIHPLTKLQWAHLRQYSSITLSSYVLSVQASNLPLVQPIQARQWCLKC